MKKILFFTILLFFALGASSQDLLYFTNGNILKAVDTEQTYDSISFRIFNSSSQQYTIDKSELVKMITETGEVIEFSGIYIDPANTEFSKNIISFNTLGVPMGRFTMGYQILSKDGKVGVEFPVSIGLLNESYTDPLPEIFDVELYSLFYSGITVNWYPMGQRKVNYVLGPSLRLGVGKNNDYYCYNCGEYNVDRQFFYTKLLINNGLVLMPSKHFSMSLIFSLGVIARDNYYNEPTFGTTADFQFNLAYQF